MDTGILLGIALLLISAKVFGELAERMKISSLVGEVFGGALVGPILHLVTPNPFLEQMAGFGILFLLFLIGLSTKFDDVKGNVYSGSILAIAGAGFSFAAGVAIGYFVFNDIMIGIFIGIAISSTSTAVTIRAVTDIGEFHSRVGKMLIAIDMADEVIAILALAMLSSVVAAKGVDMWGISALFFAVLGFILLIITAGSKFIGRFLNIFQSMRDEQILLAIPLVIVFIVAFLSQMVGLAAVTGAFLAGMAMSNSPLTGPVIVPKIKTIGYGFFIPLFFAYSALILSTDALISSWWLIILLVAVGGLAKYIGCGVLSAYYGFRDRERTIIGIGMMPRGEYAIIIAQLALGASLINQQLATQLYTIVICFVVVSIIITPILLRIFARR